MYVTGQPGSTEIPVKLHLGDYDGRNAWSFLLLLLIVSVVVIIEFLAIGFRVGSINTRLKKMEAVQQQTATSLANIERYASAISANVAKGTS